MRLDDLGAALPGWRWYRLQIKLSEDHPDLSLMIEGGVGVYELYINGARVPGPKVQSSFGVNRPVERTFPLDMPGSRVISPCAPMLRWTTRRGVCRCL